MPCACTSLERSDVTLIDIIQHDDTTYSFDFSYEDGLLWNEGDSAKLYVNVNGYSIGKKLSCASLPEEGKLRFTTRIKSSRSLYKDALSKVKHGSKVQISYPSGGFRLRRDGKPAILISNGVGIATMRALVKAFAKDPEGVGMMVQINVNHSSRLYEEEMEALAKEPICFRSVYTEHRKEFYDALDYECQKLMFQSGIIPNIYVVGSDAFIEDTSGHLLAMGFNYEDILTDGNQLLGGGCSCGSSGGCGCGANTSVASEAPMSYKVGVPQKIISGRIGI